MNKILKLKNLEILLIDNDNIIISGNKVKINEGGTQNQRGKWRQMEKKWAKKLDAGDSVDVDIRVEYPPGNSGTPSVILGEYSVNGALESFSFIN